MRTTVHLQSILVSLSLVALVGVPTPGRAASYTWGGGDLLWNNTSASGWNGGPPVAGDSATIGSGTVTFAGNDTFGNAATLSSAAITVNTGGTLASGGKFNTLWNLSLGGGTLMSNGGVTTQFPAFDLAGTVTAAGGATSSITTGTGSNNLINLGHGTAASSTTFSVGAGGTLNVGTVLQNHWYFSGTAVQVAGGLVKTGDGTLNLTAANTYTGGTTIQGGVLAFSGGGTSSTTGGVTVASGGTLRFDRNDTWGNHTTAATPVITIDSGGVVRSNNTYTTLIGPVLNGGTLSANDGVNASFPAFGLRGTVIANATAGGSTIGTSGVGDNNFVAVGTGTSGGVTTFQVADGAAASDLTVSTPLSNLAGVASGITKTGGGTMTLASANLFTGATTADAGTLALTAVGSQFTGTLKGDLVVNNATVQVTGSNGLWGWDPSVLKDLTLNGGAVLTEAGNTVVTIGNLTMAGGTLAAADNGDAAWGAWAIKPPSGSTATVTVTADSSITASRVTLNVASGTTVIDVANGATLAASSSLLGGGALTKSGGGNLSLGGASTFTGKTTVQQGTLALSGTGSIAASTTIEILAGAVLDVSGVAGGWSLASGQSLAGNGTVGGSAAISGTLAPGTSIGTLTFGGDLTLAGIASLEIDALMATADLTDVAGVLAFGGILNVSNIAGTLGSGMSFDLFDFGSRGGTSEFSAVNLPALGPGLSWDASGLYSTGTITVVPECGALSLVALGALGGWRRRR